jgi:hypothetical protein
VELRLPAHLAPVNEPGTARAHPQAISHVLLDACAESMRLDAVRLVWPVHSGAATETDLRTDAIADICDRSLLVAQLATLDAPRTGPGSRGVQIETPYADLTDIQLAEILVDMGAPLSACTTCESAGAGSECGSCGSCRRWSAALRAAGARVTAANP